MQGATAHLDYLDGWRGLAIALVLEGHFLGLLPLDAGRLGVDVFFCLSGFLMSGILFIQRQPLLVFYKRRFSRIIPAFSLFVVAMYALAFWEGRPFTHLDVVSTLAFLRTYIPVDQGIWGSGIPIGHIWSLNIEEHCYLFMSTLVLLTVLRGKEDGVLLFAGLGCLVIGVLYVKLGSKAPHWGELGTEVAASHLLISGGYRLVKEKFQLTVPGYFPIVIFGIAVLCYSKLLPWWSHSLLSPFLLAVTVNHISDTYSGVKSMLSTLPLRMLGLWSFSIYLWQQPFFMYKANFPVDGMAIVCAMGVALLSFYMVERPSRVWLNTRWAVDRLK